MSLKQTLYFMSLVGALAGLGCWALQAWLSDLVAGSAAWVLPATYTTLMGALLGGMTVGFADHWSSDGAVGKWVVMGVLLGAVAGLLSGVAYLPVLNNVVLANAGTAIARVGQSIAWIIAGGFIGLVTGLRWSAVNPLRAVHALLGGLVGGGLGGIVAATVGTNEFAQALAFVVTGMGITLGVTLAPVLVSSGVLQFVSSADPRAQNKYGHPRHEWVIQERDQQVIGSQGGSMTMTFYSREVQLYLPDAMVAPKHAILMARNRRFFVQLHPDNAGPQGQPLDPLQLRGENVVGTRELHSGDELVVGQTLLRFVTRR